jgi:hypothetical protein
VLCHGVFFDQMTRAHLARQCLQAMLKAKTHWVIGVTPEGMGYAWRLAAPHEQRCGEAMPTLCIHELAVPPLMCTLPPDKVSLDDLIGALGPLPTSPEVVESKEWILVTSGHVEVGMRAIERWADVDPLLN